MQVQIHAIYDLSDNAPECAAVQFQQSWLALPMGSGMTAQGVLMEVAEKLGIENDVDIQCEDTQDVYRFPDGSSVSGPPRFGEYRKA